MSTDHATTLASQKVWNDYLAALSDARSKWLSAPWFVTADERARALSQMMIVDHAAFSAYIAAHCAYPVWGKYVVYQPLGFGWALANPDTSYLTTFIDGARTYRIWGKRGTQRYTQLHFHAGFWGDTEQRFLAALDFDDLEFSPDGTFEITASAKKHEGNWVKLDPSADWIVVYLRDVVLDWSNDQLVELKIEALDRTPADQMWFSQEELDKRLVKMGRMQGFNVDYWFKRTSDILSKAGFNRPYAEPRLSTDGSNPDYDYASMIYEIERDEALIIETPLPDEPIYWGIQLADFCWRTLDIAYHQSSLNAHQSVADPDGKTRHVVSLVDPGVANWLDTVGVLRGVVAWRWLRAANAPVPTIKKLPLAEVRGHLAATTKSVSPEERRAALAQRREDVRRIHGV